MRTAAWEAWVDRARAVRIEDVAVRRGIKLNGKAGKNERCGPCPECGGEDRFAVNVKKQVFVCRGCGARGGDAIALVMFLDRTDFVHAVETLTGEKPPKGNGKDRAARDDARPVVAGTFPYHNAAGEIALVVERIEYRNPDGSFVMKGEKRKKTFRQKRPDPDQPGKWIWDTEGVPPLIFALPDITEAIASEHTILVVEGEGKAVLLWKWDVPATCCPGGAGKWRAEHSEYLRDADVVILPDNDAAGREHVDAVARSLAGIAKRVRVLDLAKHWPDIPIKGDVVDWVAAGHGRDALDALIGQSVEIESAKDETTAAVPPRSLAEVHTVFRRWLGDDYDLATLDAMLATVAAEQLPGDPVWLLIISGSGNAKTETVQATSGLNATVVSTIASEGALLSASSRKQKVKNATGGLLRKIGDHGILAIKDVTSILSADRNTRGPVLAALREIHDGHWVRNVGVDGGQTLEWKGRLVVVGACTTAWDQAHSVIATMGDRFVLIRSSSHTGRIGGGLRAIDNTGTETAMRAEMAAAVAGLVKNANIKDIYTLTEQDKNAIVNAADLVTLARTGVESDYRGEVIDAHDPEMPTRLAKQLTQIIRGAVAVGMSPEDALQLALRCAKDSVPQLRLAVLLDLAVHPGSRVIDIRRRLQRPRMTVDRTLQALHILGLLHCREEEEERAGRAVQTRFYSLAAGINPDVLHLHA